MVDITQKVPSARRATAQAILVASEASTIQAVLNKTVAKGDVFEFGRAAAMLAVKRTSDVVPDCHPIPIQHCAVRSEIVGLTIMIEVEVAAVYSTGVEVEAMHGAMIAALTMYDMLKPIDAHIRITNVELLNKHGGKSSYHDAPPDGLTASVIVSSDSVAAGKKADKAGKAIIKQLEKHGVVVAEYQIIPDEIEILRERVRSSCESGRKLIIITGGTGLSPRDVTPEALLPMLDRELPGVAEAIRAYGQQRTPYSMLSRSVAGVIGDAVVLALPGSTRGAEESMDAIFPALFHIFPMLKGGQHGGS